MAARPVLARPSDAGAAGVVCLAFPLHPPGRPEKSRAEELADAAHIPRLFLQGDRDAMGRPDEFGPVLRADDQVVAVASADHSFRVPKRAAVDEASMLTLIVEAVASWLEARLGE